MRTEQFIHTVTILRRNSASTGQNALGEEVWNYTAVYTAIPARVEEYGAPSKTLEYKTGAGQRKNQSTVVYLYPTVTIQLMDRVIFNGADIGLVGAVYPAYKGTSYELDHYELNIESN